MRLPLTSAGCTWLGELHLEFTCGPILTIFTDVRYAHTRMMSTWTMYHYIHRYGDFLINTISVGLASAHLHNMYFKWAKPTIVAFTGAAG